MKENLLRKDAKKRPLAASASRVNHHPLARRTPPGGERGTGGRQARDVRRRGEVLCEARGRASFDEERGLLRKGTNRQNKA